MEANRGKYLRKIVKIWRYVKSHLETGLISNRWKRWSKCAHGDATDMCCACQIINCINKPPVGHRRFKRNYSLFSGSMNDKYKPNEIVDIFVSKYRSVLNYPLCENVEIRSTRSGNHESIAYIYVDHGILEIRQYMPHFEIWLRVRFILRQNMLKNWSVQS